MSGIVYLTVAQNHPSGYRYLVTRDCTAWTAFRTRKGMREFLKFYRLTTHYRGMRDNGPRWGYTAQFRLDGQFAEFLEMDKVAFDSLQADMESWRLDNGERTLWKALHDPTGTRVYRLNCNVKTRPTVPYFAD